MDGGGALSFNLWSHSPSPLDMFLVAIPCPSSAAIAACAAHSHKRNPFPRRTESTRISTLRAVAQKTAVAESQVQGKRKRCEIFDLHNELVPYGQAWDWQKDIVRENKSLVERNQDCPDTLIVLQHHPVYTMGTGSSDEYLNFDITNAPHDIYRTERGGEVTYHGPGQLVMYPIINLRNHKMDLHWYLRSLEEVVIRALLSTFYIKASRKEGLTGVWVGDLKLAAMGIRVSSWITYHGLALNVSTDLSPFQFIVPCGIHNLGVGSLKGILGETRQELDSELINAAHNALIKEFAEVFELEIYQKSITL